MSDEGFSVRVPGKWVWAGEHSVLRGGTAITAVHPSAFLEIQAEPFGGPLQKGEEDELGKEVRTLLIELGWKPSLEQGHLHFSGQSSIPMGAGLGSSAALCVAAVRLFGALTGRSFSMADQIEKARKLEERYHGKSSGMDVSTVAHEAPLLFTMGKPPRVLRDPHVPVRFFDTGLRASTRDCIAKVNEFGLKSQVEAQAVDQLMARAVTLIQSGLEAPSPWLEALAEGMTLAHQCFEAWGLVPAEIQGQREDLLKQGARAVKLTGAGGGGFWVALWP